MCRYLETVLSTVLLDTGTEKERLKEVVIQGHKLMQG